MSKKFLLIASLVAVFLLVGVNSVLASSTLTASQTVTNLATGVTDQEAATATPQINVAQVTASSTFALSNVPTATSTVTFGQCLITLASSTDTTNETDSTTCSGNAAHFELRSAVTATPYTAAQLAANIRALTGVTSANHGALTVGGRENLVSISTTGVETSATIIELATTTAMSFATTTSVAGTIPVAQTGTITIGGTVEENDVYTINSDGLHATYTVASTDSTTSNIATGLNSAIQNASGYAAAGFTSGVSTNVVTLTASTAGTSFSAATSTVSNRSARAQTVTFTPADVASGKIFYIYINSNVYEYQAKSGDGVAEVSAGLATALSADPAATCSSTGSLVSCVAKSAGTAFTYSARVDSASSSGSSSSSGGGSRSPVIKPLTPVVPAPAIVTTITRAWSYGKSNKEINLLQEKLKKLGYLKKTQKTTNYFGVLTKAAVIKFQKANKIKPANGVLNVKTRTLLNSK